MISSPRGPLSPADLETLAEGRVRSRKVRRAVGIANISGKSMIVFGALSLAMVAFGDYVSGALGIGLVALGANELRGGSMLAKLDPRGAAQLGFNQIALGLVIVAYAGWSLYQSLHSPALPSLGGSTGDPQMDALVGDLTYLVTYGLYGTMMVVGVVGPGLTAWYYFSRARIVRDVIATTPEWVVEALRAAA